MSSNTSKKTCELHDTISQIDINSEEANNDDGEDETKTKTKIIKSRKEFFILSALSLIIFSVTCCESVLAPFFAPEAKKKKTSQIVVGAIFSIYPFWMVLLSPLIGKYLPMIGVRFCLLAGCFVEGASQIIFGFVDRLPSGSIYITYCFLIRISTATGAAMTNTASLSILTVVFKEHVAFVFGITEIFNGLGYMSGPVIGGILYKVGHFKLPFIVCGAILLVILAWVTWFLPPEKAYRANTNNNNETELKNDEKENNQVVPISQALRIPGVLVMCLCAITLGFILSYLEPVLAEFLTSIDPKVTSQEIGLVFFSLSVTYVLAMPILGFLMGKKISGRTCLIIGHFGMAVCTFLTGPSPLVKPYLESSVNLVLVSMLFNGLFCGFFCIPILGDMQVAGINGGLPQTLGTDSLLSGLFNGSYAIGCTIGPLLSSLLVDNFTFEWTATVIAFFTFAEGIFVTVFTWYEKRNSPTLKNYMPIS